MGAAQHSAKCSLMTAHAVSQLFCAKCCVMMAQSSTAIGAICPFPRFTGATLPQWSAESFCWTERLVEWRCQGFKMRNERFSQNRTSCGIKTRRDSEPRARKTLERYIDGWSVQVGHMKCLFRTLSVSYASQPLLVSACEFVVSARFYSNEAPKTEKLVFQLL